MESRPSFDRREPVASQVFSNTTNSRSRRRPVLCAAPTAAKQGPLSYGQRRLFFLDRLGAGRAEFHVVGALRLRGRLNVPALQRAVQSIVDRHDSLRTYFVGTSDDAAQIVVPHLDVWIAVDDCRGLDADRKRTIVADTLQRERAEPFDLGQLPLLRLRLLQLADDEHVLVRTMHHIVCDGWSETIFERELLLRYDAYCSGLIDPLSPLPVQYLDFTKWQRELLDGGGLEAGLDYWTRQLNAMPERLQFPTDRARPDVPTANAASHYLTISADRISALTRVGQSEGTTLYMTLLSAFSALLVRYAGQDDVIVGTPIANRRDPQLEGLIGFFVNTLVLRVQPKRDATLRTLLQDIRKTVLDAYRHQDVPFDEVVRVIAPSRELDTRPLTQTEFTLHASTELLQPQGLVVERLPVTTDRARIDLEVRAHLQHGALSVSWLYNRDLFDGWRVEQMARHYDRLLESLTTDVDRRVDAVELMSERERNEVIAFSTGPEVTSVGMWPTLFETQVASTPDAVALVCQNSAVTYADLNQKTNRLAHLLIRHGIGPEERVAIALDRSLDLAVAIGAVLKAGAAFVPLDPGYPAERLRFMIAEAKPCAVITSSQIVLPAGDCGIRLLLDTPETIGALAAQPTSDPSDPQRTRALAPDHPAYVVFTSGSTGVPKGVIGLHVGLANRYKWFTATFDFHRMYPTLFQSSISFLDGATELLAPLTRGGAVVIADASEAKDPIALTRIIASRGVGLVTAVPSFLPPMLDGLQQLPSTPLRYWISSGEALTSLHIRRFTNSLPSVQLINLYGLSECSADSTYALCSVPESSIGQPMWNTRAYVLDHRLQPIPVGVAGDLYLGGIGLARGYWRNSALTASRFVCDPHVPGARMYRTGDLVRQRRDGTLEYLGRSDRQVKVRGIRIELGEIEAALRACPGVDEAAVTVSEDESGDKRLAGYVVPREGITLDVGEIRRKLTDDLPEYMRPASVVALSAFPLTPSGKLDRKALPAPDFSMQLVTRRAPRTPHEEMLCDLFADVLGLPQVGIDDNFFEIGGHSLLAMTVVSRIRAILSIDIPLEYLFDSPSVAELAPHLHERGAGRGMLQVSERPARVPLSYAQQRLWFLHRLGDAVSTAYHLSTALRLSGRLDIGALERALRSIVERHEILRTRFAEDDHGVVQVISPHLDIPLQIEVLQELDSDAQSAAVESALRRERVQPFDLERGPVLRFLLLRLGSEEHVLVRTMHHVASDAWSDTVFHHELAVLYEAYQAGQPDPLPPLAIQYADFALWQRELLATGPLEEGLSYWKAQLAEIPQRLEWPTDRPRPDTPTFVADVHDVTLTAAQLAALRTLNQREHVTLYMALLTALGVVLSRYSGQSDIVVGSPIANRQDAQLEGLIGFFVNALPLRLRVTPRSSLGILLADVRQTTLEAYRHQDVPFEEIVKALGPSRELTTSPIFDVVLALQNAPTITPRLGSLVVTPMRGPAHHVRVDVEVHVWERDGEVTLSWLYNRDLFDGWRIEQLARHHVRVLEALCGDLRQTVDTVALVDAAERERLLTTWPMRAALPVAAPTWLAQFAAQVARTPEAVALVCEGETLTYGALAQRAATRAAQLRAAGIGTEDVVAIAMERSLELWVTVLGVMIAGAAYLPLDPAHPPERLAWMVTDAQPALVVTGPGGSVALPASCRQWAIDAGAPPAVGPPRTEAGAATPAQAAYLMYTSGSTGRPKAVVVSHAGLPTLAAAQIAAFSIDAESRVLQLSNATFDASVSEMVTTWGVGGVLVVAPRETPSGAALRDLLIRERITHATIPPALLATLDVVPPDVLSTLVVAGEACPPALVTRWAPGRRMLNAYGPTETTVCATVSAPLTARATPPPIGQPIPQAQVYVFDARLAPVPAGVVGEVYVGGPQLARGYARQPGLTAARFIAAPYGSAGARWYRTGDLAYWDADGVLHYVGRNDQQVQLRGMRVELGEIEAVLRAVHASADAVVVLREDRPGEPQLVGYVVADTPLDADAIRARLQERLPAALVPAAVVSVPAWPRTPHGKIDRRALPPPDWRAHAAIGRSPQTPEETILCALFAEVLGVTEVGVDANFFALGGHSLLATQLVSRIRTTLGREVALRTVFEAATPSALASRLPQAPGGRPPLVARPRPPVLPLSYAQQRLWFLHRLRGRSHEYHVSEALRLRGLFDAALLRRAIQAIVDRHECLRTHFREVDGTPVQIIEPTLHVSLPIEDLSELDEPAQLERVQHLWHVDRTEPFDLSRGPLFRVRLMRLADNDHVLVRTFHHIVSDGWAHAVFNQELVTHYDAYRANLPNPLPALSVQYADFALWQRECLEAGALDAGLAYWTTQLAGVPDELPIPRDRPRPADQAFVAGVYRWRTPAGQVEGLKQVSRTHGATLFMTILAALDVLLACYTGQDDIIVGTPVANRQDPKLEGLIGFFINTLVLRARVQRQSFSALLAEVRQVTLDAYRHQDVPFERVVEALAPERTLSRMPLVQVVLSFHNTRELTLAMADLEVEPLGSTDETLLRHDIELQVRERNDALEITWLYSRDLFDAWRIEQMARHYARVLEIVAAGFDRPIGWADLLEDTERRQLVSKQPKTLPDREYAGTVSLIEDRVAKASDSVALVFGDSSLTYQALNRRANRLAYQLIDTGIGPGDVVTVVADSSPMSIVAFLGALKAGAAYEPLDPEYPDARKADIIAEIRPRVILACGDTALRLPADCRALVHDIEKLSRTDESIVESNPTNAVRVRPLSGDHLAYVIHTSGSTGRPKGVMITHHNLLRSTVARQEYYTEIPHRFLLLSSLSFDSSVVGVFWTLVEGGALHVVSERIRRDPRLLADVIASRAISHLLCLPSFYDTLIDPLSEQPNAMQAVIVAGEECSAPLVHKHDQSIDAALYNEYGPTEATVWSTAYRHQSGMVPSSIPIGRQIGDTRVYVLDARLEPVPRGVSGELYLAGPQIARGYWGQSSLSAARFVSDPYGPAGTRMYRTGDVARWDADGALHYAGRNDQQVKVRGVRVELGEIEAALRAVHASTDAVVLLREDRPGDQQLVGYVVAAGPVDSSALRARLQERLPATLVPAAVVSVPAWPRTPHGKIDRRALPPPDWQSQAAAGQMAQTPEEAVLCELFAEVLGVADIGADDDFFELGGHSLLAVQLVSRIRARLHVDVEVATIFEAGTPSLLAERLPQAPVGRPPLVAQPRPSVLPLSYAQQRLWFLQRLAPERATYSVPLAFRLTGPLVIDALAAALTDLVTRHEVLRTRLVEHDGVPAQEIQPPAPVPLPVVATTTAELSAQLTAASAVPFALERESPLRAQLFRLAPDQHVLLMLMHHSASDGVSLDPLQRELAAAYAARRRGEAPAWTPLPVQYADYTLWQRALLGREEDPTSLSAQQLAYWDMTLREAPAQIALPTDYARPALASDHGGSVPVQLPADIHARLQGVAHEQQASLFIVLHAALAALLTRLGAGPDIVVGTVIAGRTDRVLEEMVGLFVNTVVLRTSTAGHPSWTELIRRTRATALAAYAHAEVPFERLVDLLQPERSLARHPLVQVLLSLDSAASPTVAWDGLAVTPFGVELRHAKFDLALTLRETRTADGTPAGVMGHLNYRTDLFTPATAARIAIWFERMATAFAAAPAAPCGAADLLSPAERTRVLHTWNATAMPLPSASVSALIEAQVARAPDALAVVCDNQSLTYAALDQHATRLAKRLRARGIGPEAIVGVALDRSIELVATMLAVWKAGGVYLPMDPSYPVERLRSLLRDAKPQMVLAKRAHRGLFGDELEMFIDEEDERPLKEDVAQTGQRPATYAEQASYAIYTSGSTGSPKGVLVSQSSAVNILVAGGRALRLQPGDVMAAMASPSFDISILEMVAPLVAGATTRLVDWRTALAGEHLDSVDVIHAVPSAMREIVDALRGPSSAPARVQRLATGGERVPRELLKAMAQATPGEDPVVLYGPTEATMICAAETLSASKPSPIGAPLGNVQMYVLDEELQPTPIGITGDLFVAGSGIARGYLGRPAITAAAFVANVYGDAGTRMYRTGDRARWSADGTLEYMGRSDLQVKIRGFRIELGEVESVLRSAPGVADAVAVVRSDAHHELQLVAYIVASAEDRSSSREHEALRWLRQQLPDYMIPAAIIELPQLPITRNGKVDRSALPAPDWQQDASRAPETELESLLCDVFAEVLGRDRVGMDDDFFRVGGHSLMVIRLINRIRTTLGVDVSIQRVFEAPTVALLADAIEGSVIDSIDAISDEEALRLVAAVPADRSDSPNPAG